MVLANIKDAERYYALNTNFVEVFDFLKTLTKNSKEGIVRENYYVNFSGEFVDTADKNPDGTEKVLEAHKKYIDIHYCVSGSEGIGYAETSSLEAISEYDDKDDYVLLKGEYRKVILNEGDFCIVFPEDAHIPVMKGSSDGKLLKAVAKIKL